MNEFALNRGGQVTIRIPQANGEILVLEGFVQTLSQSRGMAPIYTMGNEQPYTFSTGRTNFTLEGIITDRVASPPKTRWELIADELE